MRNSRISLALIVAGLAACGGSRGPTLAEVDPFLERQAPRQALPDEAERRSGRLAAYALNDDAARAREMLEQVRAAEAATPPAEDGRARSLSDNGQDLILAMGGSARYPEAVEELLGDDELDPVLRSRIGHYIDGQPLRVAERRLDENRRWQFGVVFNRTVSPLFRIALGGGLQAIEAVRSTISSLLSFHDIPEASIYERQALRAYKEHLARKDKSLHSGKQGGRGVHHCL